MMIDVKFTPGVPSHADGVLVLLVDAEQPDRVATLGRCGVELPPAEAAAKSEAAWWIGERRFVFKAAPVARDWQLADKLLEAFGRGVTALTGRDRRSVAVVIPEFELLPPAVQDALVGAVDDLRHDPGWLKTDGDRARPPLPARFSFVVKTPAARRRIERDLPRLRAIGEGRLWARRLTDLPPNLLGPEQLYQEARHLGRYGAKVSVAPASILAAMGGVSAVGRGSAHPPRFIIVELGDERRGPPVVLVGKGVTFDSGGLSLKTREGMANMKNDMGGAAMVLGALLALARIGGTGRVVGLLPAVENMPDGDALRVGDVITMFDGRTVEVTNTDAEGRLILADALAYARHYDPAVTVDAATLTGAVATALGTRYAGLFCADPDLSRRLQSAAGRGGELLWPLPLDPLFLEPLKSTIADLRNSSNKPYGGACNAAAFLATFAPHPWAHLDVAGTVFADQPRPGNPVGATGYGVRTLVEFLLDVDTTGRGARPLRGRTPARSGPRSAPRAQTRPVVRPTARVAGEVSGRRTHPKTR